MARLIIGVSGIRGYAGENLTKNTARQFGRAVGLYMGGQKKTVVIGRDTRPSGPELTDGFVSGLSQEGISVIDLGISPTPTVEMAVTHLKAHGGVIITASHNPMPYNGFKFLGPHGIFLDAFEMNRVISIYHGLYEKMNSHKKNIVVKSYSEAFSHHLERILELNIINTQAVRARGFTVVLDSVNGVGAGNGKKLLTELGCTVHEINNEPTGVFGRGAEPVPANLGDLEKAVIEHEAEVGFALDPDGDRLSLVSEKGRAIGEEYTLALSTAFVLGKTKGDVVCNLSTSRMIDDIVERFGVEVHRSPVGEINVVRLMEKVGAVFGGEGNGGVILPELHYGRDAFLGMALILELLTESNRTLSEEAARFPHYSILKEKIPLEDYDKSCWQDMIAGSFPDAQTDEHDGIKFIWDDRWVHVRASNTEPILRVMAEAPSREESKTLIRQIFDLMKKC